MGNRASYPEYSEADYLVEMHSCRNRGRRAGMIVAAVGMASSPWRCCVDGRHDVSNALESLRKPPRRSSENVSSTHSGEYGLELKT
jgi:hypothetical protein